MLFGFRLCILEIELLFDTEAVKFTERGLGKLKQRHSLFFTLLNWYSIVQLTVIKHFLCSITIVNDFKLLKIALLVSFGLKEAPPVPLNASHSSGPPPFF